MTHRLALSFGVALAGCVASTDSLDATPAPSSAAMSEAGVASPETATACERLEDVRPADAIGSTNLARETFVEGVHAYEEGRYADALGCFCRVYRAAPSPELLYNIGAAYERLELRAQAADHYELFLERIGTPPNVANEDAVRARVRELRAEP